MIRYSFALHDLYYPAGHITVEATLEANGLSAKILVYIPDGLDQKTSISRVHGITLSPRLKRSLIQRAKTFLNRKETCAEIARM